MEETSFSSEAVKDNTQERDRRNTSLAGYLTKDGKKRKEKHVAFITSYNGLILQ